MYRTIFALAGALALFGCGGGGGGNSTGGSNDGGTNPPPSDGINGGGSAFGAITGFGSIFVNGIEFSTSNATVHIEDSIGTEDDLRLGQVVEVRGTIDDGGMTGDATEVFFSDDLKGPIEGIDFAAGTFTVLGQTVVVTGGTVFDDSIAPAGLSGLAVGDVVEVSGFPNGKGQIVASRIEPGTVGGELQSTGTVSGLDSAQSRFDLGVLIVDYSGATIEDGTLANGACVEVKGSSVSGNVLTATRVEIESCGLTGANGERGEIEGFITRFVSPTDFDVGGQRVTTTATTIFEGGVAADLHLGLKVEAEGSFNADDTLVASKVDIRTDTSVRVLGTVESIDATTDSVSIFGIDIEVTSATRLEDQSDARVEPLGFDDLRTGDYLEVRGFADTEPGSMVAALLERENPDTRNELQGTATSVAQPSFEILTVSIMTDASTEYRDASDAAISAGEFFAMASNRLVKVRGSWNGATLVAEQAELESL